jgi:hypothetical protein
MKKYFFPFKKIFSYLTDLKFALLILFLIAGTSSLGSIIEQDETIEYYQNTYPSVSPLYGFVDWKWITFWGFDHLYQTWWFVSLLLLLSVCLISCTLTRQFPLYWNSKEFFFQKQKTSFYCNDSSFYTHSIKKWQRGDCTSTHSNESRWPVDSVMMGNGADVQYKCRRRSGGETGSSEVKMSHWNGLARWVGVHDVKCHAVTSVM